MARLSRSTFWRVLSALALPAFSVFASLLLLALLTAPVLLRAFGPAIPHGAQPLLCGVFWLLALLAIGGANRLAERRPEFPSLGVLAGALVLVAVPLIPTAVFTWQAVTDHAYADNGGITSCTVGAVERKVEEYNSAMTGERREEITYVHTLSCDAAEVTAWTADEPLTEAGEAARFEYDADGRFTVRPFEPHRPWADSARIARDLFAASVLVYLATCVYALRREALGRD